MKKYTILLFVALSLFASIPNKIDISEIKEVLSASNPKLKNNISNLQVAPFDNSIVSFETIQKKGKLRLKRLFLYNVSKNRLLEIESKKYSSKTSNRSKRFPKNYGLVWHPKKPIFVFSGNGYMGQTHLFIVKILDSGLMNTFALKGFHIGLDKEQKIFCKEPSFSPDGNSLFFARKVYIKKKRTYYKICRIDNLDIALKNTKKGSGRFENYPFSVYAESKYDLRDPKCSPNEDRNLIAYIRITNQRSRGQKDFYQKYDIVISDIDNNEKQTRIGLDGFRTYSYFWGLKGEFLYYQKSRKLVKTPQSFVDKRRNLIDLAFTKVITPKNNKNKILNLIQSNQKKDVLFRDINPGINNMSFLDDKRFFVSKFAPKKGWRIFLLDIPKWRKRANDYTTMLELGGIVTIPKYANGKLVFLAQKGKSNSLCKANLKIELGAQKEILAKQKEINTKLKAKNESIVKLKKDISKLDLEIEKLVKIKKSEMLKIEKKHKLITKKSTKKSDLETAIVKLKIDKANLMDKEAHLVNLNKNKDELKAKLSNVNSSIKQMKKKQRGLSKSLSSFIVNFNDKKNLLSELQINLDDFIAKKKEKEAMIAKQKAEEEALLKEEEEAQAEEEGVLLGDERIDLGETSSDNSSNGDEYSDEYSDEYDDEYGSDDDSSDDTDTDRELKTRP